MIAVQVGVRTAIAVVAFVAGAVIGALLVWQAWDRGCVVEATFGIKALKVDCSSRQAEGIPVEFVSPTEPLPLGAALKRVATMTDRSDRQRVFLDPAVESSNIASKIVTPPGGRHGALTIVRQLLVDADATAAIDICLVPNGYRIQSK
jgi:hypothetical protein